MKTVLFVLRHTRQQFEKNTKYKGIMSAFKRAGYTVTYSMIDDNKIVLLEEKSETVIGRCFPGNIGNKIAANINIYDCIGKYMVRNNVHYDISYVRMMPATGTYVRLLSILHKMTDKVVVEIPSYPPGEEMKSDKRLVRKLLYQYLCYQEIKTSKYVNLYAVIGDECEEYHGVKAINISNGIEIESVKKRIAKKCDKIHILALAKMARWHAYDRLIEGLRIDSDNGYEDVVLHMVGNDGDGSLAIWKAMVDSYKLNDRVIFHGPLYGKELDDMFDLCDIAVASLGLHRKQALVTSELKIREYCARGIPFVYSAHDPDILEEAMFCLKVPLDDTPIEIRKIVDLAKRYSEDENGVNLIRKYCKEHMTWDKQVKKIIDEL